MIYTAVCDDNEVMLDFIARRAEELFSENGLECEVRKFTRADEFLASHNEKPFDVVFMDILMPDTNGFEAAKQIHRASGSTYIIFVTTQSSLVYESFDFQPFYFIPKEKPQLLEERLSHVVKKLVLVIYADEKIFVEGTGDNVKYISPSRILYIKSSANNIVFHLTENENLQTRKKLADLYAELNKSIFVRIHNRIVVNMKHIERVKYSTNDILLDNGETLGISRAHKQEFKDAHIRFMRNFS